MIINTKGYKNIIDPKFIKPKDIKLSNNIYYRYDGTQYIPEPEKPGIKFNTILVSIAGIALSILCL